MNFGSIFDTILKQCTDLLVEGKHSDAKKLATEFLRYVSLKEPLKRQFQVYDNIRSAHFENKELATLFLFESLSILDGLQLEDLRNYNKLLMSKFGIKTLKQSDIDKNINWLIESKVQSNNDKIRTYKSFEFVLNEIAKPKIQEQHTTSELTEEIKSKLSFVEPKTIIKMAVKSFNDEYQSQFSILERKAFIVLQEKNQAKISKFFSSILEECVIASTDLSISDVMKNKILLAISELKSVKNNPTMDDVLNVVELCEAIKETKNENNK